jgi:hypothetical protein
MKPILALDCETIPALPFVDAADQPVPATGVLPALHPTTCRVVSVNWGWLKNTAQRWLPATEVVTWPNRARVRPASQDCAKEEQALLQATLERLASAVGKGTLLVTFNGKQFDLWMLRMRAAILRVPTSRIPWSRLLYPYSEDLHCDLRLVLGNHERRAVGTLEAWCSVFGIASEDRGAEVWDMVREGRWADLVAYGETEGRTLVELYLAMEGVL